jgi:hypothetical protein
MNYPRSNVRHRSASFDRLRTGAHGKRSRQALRGIKQECHARENGHPSWIPSFEEMTNAKQASGNLPGVEQESSCLKMGTLIVRIKNRPAGPGQCSKVRKEQFHKAKGSETVKVRSLFFSTENFPGELSFDLLRDNGPGHRLPGPPFPRHRVIPRLSASACSGPGTLQSCVLRFLRRQPAPTSPLREET